MSPATSWTEGSQALQGWAEYGFPPGVSQRTVLFGAMLVLSAGQAPVTPAYTEASVAATSHTEGSVAATTWVELT